MVDLLKSLSSMIVKSIFIFQIANRGRGRRKQLKILFFQISTLLCYLIEGLFIFSLHFSPDIVKGKEYGNFNSQSIAQQLWYVTPTNSITLYVQRYMHGLNSEVDLNNTSSHLTQHSLSNAIQSKLHLKPLCGLQPLAPNAHIQISERKKGQGILPWKKYFEV